MAAKYFHMAIKYCCMATKYFQPAIIFKVFKVFKVFKNSKISLYMRKSKNQAFSYSVIPVIQLIIFMLNIKNLSI
jgi:hypothetical protein